MENPAKVDLPPELLALKAANDQVREAGKQSLWSALDRISAEVSRQLTQHPGGEPLQVGRQEWQFALGTATMVGERFGARHRGRTLLVEVGWPRLPEHGFIPNRGLARGRIGFSQNTMLQPKILAELVLRKPGDGAPQWLLLAQNAPDEPLTESRLQQFFLQLIAES